MRVIVLVKASKASEAGIMPSAELVAQMSKFNEQLLNAGIMLAGEGLHPSSKGVRIRCTGNDRTVIRGPFTETSELVAGYWIWKVKSLEEAIEWLKRAPFHEGEIEIRPIFDLEDFAAQSNLPPELVAQEKTHRAQAEKNAQ